MPPQRTTIPLTTATRSRLEKFGHKGQTWDQLLNGVMDNLDDPTGNRGLPRLLIREMPRKLLKYDAKGIHPGDPHRQNSWMGEINVRNAGPVPAMNVRVSNYEAKWPHDRVIFPDDKSDLVVGFGSSSIDNSDPRKIIIRYSSPSGMVVMDEYHFSFHRIGPAADQKWQISDIEEVKRSESPPDPIEAKQRLGTK